MKKVSTKEPYIAPSTEIIPLEVAAPVMQGSFTIPNYGDNDMFRTSPTRNQGRGASTSELEDMINDILTIDK